MGPEDAPGPRDWEQLEREVRDLARRVAQLERQTGVTGPESEAAAEGRLLPPAPSPYPQPPLHLAETAGLVAMLGRALLGLAGAYLLRALTDARAMPVGAGIGVGILYAVLWLVWAARTPPARRLEAALHSLTAVLILSPLLWEATLRFHTLGEGTAGALLVCFALAGMVVSWRKNLLIVSTIATLAALATAAGLLLATNNVLPFTWVFLAIAAAVEASAAMDHWLSERWLAATAADLAVLLATWLVTNEGGLPASYAPIPHSLLLVAQVALLGIYLASTTTRTLFRGFPFTNFEIAQCVAAFAISVSGALRLSKEDPRLAPAMAILMLACAAGSYLVSFAFLERRENTARNFYTYSTFGILLTLAGSRILLSGLPAAAAWSLLALASIWAGGVFARITLAVHGATYLLLALVTAGAPQQAEAFLLGADLWPGFHAAVLAIAALAAAIAYLLSTRPAYGESGWNSNTLRLTLAAALVWMLLGIAAGSLTALYHALFGATASHAYCATLRTGILAASAVFLAWAGPRWRRAELSQLIYPAMFLGAYRLLASDLHQDRKVALFLSLLVYGAALTALPRIRTSRAG
jgi:hypothetical protein